MLRKFALFLWFLSIACLYQHFPPLKNVPMLLFPGKQHIKWTLNKQPQGVLDERILCIHTAWNYDLPTPHMPQSHSNTFQQLENKLGKQIQKLTDLKHSNTSTNNPLDPYFLQQTTHFYIHKPIKPRNILREWQVSWYQSGTLIARKFYTPTVKNLPQPFQWQWLLWIQSNQHKILIPQTHPIPMTDIYKFQNWLNKQSKDIPFGFYDIFVE